MIQELSFPDIDKVIKLTDSDIPNAASGSHWEWVRWFQQGIKLFGVHYDDTLIAIGGLSFYDFDGTVKDPQKATYAVLCNCFVVPQYRGHGYHRKLIAFRLDFLESAAISDIRVFVYKDNYYSQNNIENSGFVVDPTKGTQRKFCYVYCHNEV